MSADLPANSKETKAPRVFFASGPGNIIEAHKNWRRGVDDPSQMSITFSSELESFCQMRASPAYLVASRSPASVMTDGQFVIEHRPKRSGRGIRYHLGEVRYGLGLLMSAVNFKADYAVIQSGTTHFFMLSLFSLFSIKVIPVLHNTLWPSGFRSRSVVRCVVETLDAAFFRWIAASTICVSPECARQVDQVTKGRHGPILEIAPQFERGLFPLHAPPTNCVPFRLIFSGRIVREKGVFDLLEIMRETDQRIPGRVKLQICGDGPELDALLRKREEMALGDIVSIKGRVEPNVLRQLVAESHAAIVPTRSEFPEGMAMTAIEAILLGRPVITSPVVPALEVLNAACLAAMPDNVSSYVDAVVTLVRSADLYQRLVSSCSDLREAFLDRKHSFGTALEKAIM